MLAWLVPNHYPPWLSFHGESLMFVALLAWTLARAGRGIPQPVDYLSFVVLSLLLIIGWQWASGLIAYRGDAVVSSLYLLGFWLAWQLGISVAAEPAQRSLALDLFAWLLVVAAACSTYAAVAQWLSQELRFGGLILVSSPGMRPYGNLAQPNQLASLLLMGIVMAVWLFHRKRLQLWQFVALVSWLSWGLTLAESRAAWLSAWVLGSVLIWRGRSIWPRASWQVVITWWSGLILMRAAWPWLQQALLLAGPHTGFRSLEVMVQDNGRLPLWHQLLAGIYESPWWGYGWRQTIAGHKAGTAHVGGGQMTDYAHNIILDLALWLGLPLALLFISAAAWWLWRALRRAETPTELLLLGATIPVMVHSLVEFPFAYAYFLFPLAWLLGALAATQAAQAGAAPKSRGRWPGHRLTAGVGLLFAGLSFWIASEYLLIEEDYRVLRFELRNVGTRPTGYHMPQPILLDQLGAILQQGRVQPHPEMSDEELEAMRRLLRNYNWSTLQAKYIAALMLNDRAQEAHQELFHLRQHYGTASYEDAWAYLQQLAIQYEQLQGLKPL